MKPSLWVGLFFFATKPERCSTRRNPFWELAPSSIRAAALLLKVHAKRLASPGSGGIRPPQNSSDEAAWQRRTSISRAALGGCVSPQRDLRLLLSCTPPSAQWLQHRAEQTPLLPSSLGGLVRSAGSNQVLTAAPGGYAHPRPSMLLLPRCCLVAAPLRRATHSSSRVSRRPGPLS